MHQPWYGEPRGGRMILPWTRLHALKDYLDMIAVAERHPTVHMTFNLVPSLLLQLDLYATGRTTDRHRELAGLAPEDLDDHARRQLLEDAFKCHWDRLVEPYPRFRELLYKRGRNLATTGLDAAVARFTIQDWRDLQVYSHLAWCGHELRATEPLVAALLRQGRDFTEEQKQALLAKLDAVVGTILPRYVAAAQAGQIELSTTPFYHPILPLLCHWPVVRAGLPGCRIPPGVEDLPEDAETQLRRGRELFEQLVGFAPTGLWPSEGSVSTRTLELAASCGFEWAATDERILERSLRRMAAPGGGGGRQPEPSDFFRAHRHAGVDVFFRHHRASDRIGFDYATWGAGSAVSDFISLLERSARSAAGLRRPVVPVILDGENCWEYYEDNGFPFLDALYRSLADHPWLEPVTFSEHRARADEPPTLDWLFPGSWIGGDFYIWAGHREDQRAWELLHAARRALVAGQAGLDAETNRRAWEHLYIAEGSDWYWWYGDDHSSADDAAFDQLFRSHLQRIYELLGETPPEALYEPICGLAAPMPLTPPAVPFTPLLDGRESSFFEWRAAGVLHGHGPAGAMSRTDGQPGGLRRVRYGFDDEQLYFAVELDPTPDHADEVLEFDWTAHGRVVRLEIPAPRRPRRESLPLTDGVVGAAEVAVERLLELAVPRAALPAAAGELAELWVGLRRAGEAVDRWPHRGAFAFPVPDENEWLRHWLV